MYIYTHKGNHNRPHIFCSKCAHFQLKFGDLSLEEALAIIETGTPNDEQAQLLANGMENLVGVLGGVCSDLDAPKH